MLEKVKEALEAYENGDTQTAITSLERIDLKSIDPLLKGEIENVLESYDLYNSYVGPDRFDVDKGFEFSFYSLQNYFGYLVNEANNESKK